MPLAADEGVWTPPYFDAGRGEIGMSRARFRRGTRRVSLPSSPLIFLWTLPAGRFVPGQDVDPVSPNSSAYPGLDDRCECLDLMARRSPYKANVSCQARRAQCAGRRCATHRVAAVGGVHTIVVAVRTEDWTRARVGPHSGATLYAAMPS